MKNALGEKCMCRGACECTKTMTAASLTLDESMQSLESKRISGVFCSLL